MIRMIVLIGTIGVLIAGYLTVFAVGPISQSPPSESLLAGFRAKGFIPAEVNLEEDEAAHEAEVFEVPPEDAVMLAHMMEGMMDMPGMDMPGMEMPGMDMSGMKMDGDGEMQMSMEGDGMKMDMPGMEMPGMDMPGMEMPGMDMPGMDMSGMDMSSMDMSGMKMDDDGEAAHADDDEDGEEGEHMGGSGILIAHEGEFDREIKLTMAEWKYSDMMIDVKIGERIKFTVINGGQIPHEFMFMDMPLMSSVEYRIKRADWSLLEHEALYEKPLVLPGGEFSFVLTVTQPGSWMFMCMLPYHMQMGMMGMMATKGMAMDMNMEM